MISSCYFFKHDLEKSTTYRFQADLDKIEHRFQAARDEGLGKRENKPYESKTPMNLNPKTKQRTRAEK